MGGTIRDLIGIDINWKESKFGAQFYHLDIWYSAGLQRRAHVDICTVRNSRHLPEFSMEGNGLEKDPTVLGDTERNTELKKGS